MYLPVFGLGFLTVASPLCLTCFKRILVYDNFEGALDGWKVTGEMNWYGQQK